MAATAANVGNIGLCRKKGDNEYISYQLQNNVHCVDINI